MKTFIYFLTLSCFFLNTFAQQESKTFSLFSKKAIFAPQKSNQLNLLKKAAISERYKLDSIVGTNMLERFTYDGFGNNLSEYSSYSQAGMGSFTNYREFQYDVKRLKTIIEFDWNDDTNKPEKRSKREFDYNNDNLINSETMSETNGDNWFFSTKTLKFYNAKKLKTHEVSYMYGSDWVNNDSTVYKYNENDKLSDIIKYSWDNFSEKWQDTTSLTHFAYNSSGLITEMAEYYKSIDKWTVSNKVEYKHDDAGNINEVLTSYREKDSLKYAVKINYEFDNGNPVSVIFSSYNETTKGWIYEQKEIIHYNNDITGNFLILPYSEVNRDEKNMDGTNPYSHLPVKAEVFDFENNQWVKGSQGEIRLFFSPLGSTNSVANISSEKATIYPSIVSKTFNSSESGKIEIYNIIGKLVKSVQVQANSAIDVSNLSNGTYIVKLTRHQGQYITKIIKQ